MSRLRVVVVDDEQPAIDRLIRLMAQAGGAEVCAQLDDPQRVLDACCRLQPDVVFLDIEMPGLNGIQLAQKLATLASAPAIVFVTAFEQYAVEAFEVEAVDYLVKPVRPDRLAQALERARNRPVGSDATISTRLGDRVQAIPVAGIRALVSEDKYTVVHFEGGQALLDDSLVSLEQRLGPLFVRTHRKALVARRYLRGLYQDEHGQDRVELVGVSCHPPVSRRNLARIRELLEAPPAQDRSRI